MNNNIINIGSVVFGCTVAEVSTLPICTIKSVYQNTNNTSITDTVRTIYKERGIKGFYNAYVPAILSQVLSSTMKYGIYRYMGDKRNNTTYIQKCTNSMIAGISTSLITHPIDVVRISMQLGKYISVSEWMKILYRGYSKSLSKVMLGSITFFPLMDVYKEKLYKLNTYHNDIPLVSNSSLNLMASFMSAFTSTIIFQPVDYLKTRHMAGSSLGYGFNMEFIKSLGKGLQLNLLRIVPHFTIMMSITEGIRDYYKKE